MGLLDKIFKKDPFADETVKKYYEISYGLLASVGDKGVNFDGIKKYIEYCLGDLCDTEKLKVVLEFFKKTGSPAILHCLYYNEKELTGAYNAYEIPRWKAEKVLEVNRICEKQTAYRCTKNEAYNICYKEIIDDIELEYKKVLEVVAESGVRCLKEGVNRIIKKYERITGSVVIEDCIHTSTYNRFFANDPVVEAILLTYLLAALRKEIRHEAIAGIALRASHFEEYGKNEEGYTTITEETCRNFVLNNEYFKSEIAKHPYDKSKYIDSYTHSIMQCSIFAMYYADSFSCVECWMPRFNTELYYTDIICNRCCKDVQKQYSDVDLTNPQDVYDMLWNRVNRIS